MRGNWGRECLYVYRGREIGGLRVYKGRVEYYRVFAGYDRCLWVVGKVL